MNILMLLDSEFPPDVRVESEAQSLLQQGHEVHILSFNYGTKKDKELYNGIHIHRFHINKQVAKKALGLIHRLPIYKNIWKREVTALLNSEKFDAVHIHDLPLCILTKYISENFKLKVVADMHENYPYLVANHPYMNTLFAKLFLSKKIWFTKEKEWLSNATDIICVAPEMKSRLDKVLNNKYDIKVVPNTISFNSFVAKQKPIEGLKERFKNYFTILYIGGFDSQRGLEHLIEATALVKDKIPNIKVLLVGDGNIVPELKSLATSLAVEDLLIFEGWQSQDHIQAYIEVADICVIPHIKSVHSDNTSSNKVFQFMYFKKPIIASNCRSIEKPITEENCGLIFKDRDNKDLADKIITLYNDPELRASLGMNGFNAVNNKYNWDITCKGLLEVYNK